MGHVHCFRTVATGATMSRDDDRHRSKKCIKDNCNVWKSRHSPGKNSAPRRGTTEYSSY